MLPSAALSFYLSSRSLHSFPLSLHSLLPIHRLSSLLSENSPQSVFVFLPPTLLFPLIICLELLEIHIFANYKS